MLLNLFLAILLKSISQIGSEDSEDAGNPNGEGLANSNEAPANDSA